MIGTMQIETTVLRGLPVIVEAEFDGRECVSFTIHTYGRNGKKRRAKWVEKQVDEDSMFERIREEAGLD